jgi:hypothetical protein
VALFNKIVDGHSKSNIQQSKANMIPDKATKILVPEGLQDLDACLTSFGRNLRFFFDPQKW